MRRARQVLNAPRPHSAIMVRTARQRPSAEILVTRAAAGRLCSSYPSDPHPGVASCDRPGVASCDHPGGASRDHPGHPRNHKPHRAQVSSPHVSAAPSRGDRAHIVISKGLHVAKNRFTNATSGGLRNLSMASPGEARFGPPAQLETQLSLQTTNSAHQRGIQNREKGNCDARSHPCRPNAQFAKGARNSIARFDWRRLRLAQSAVFMGNHLRPDFA